MKLTSITILYGVGGVSKEIHAYVFGQWAAHQTAHGIQVSWGVTHVPSGKTLNSLTAELDRGDSIALARSLARRTAALGEAPSATPSDEHNHIIMATVAEYLSEGRCL